MTSTREESALYLGRVMHRRLKPVAHRFEYKVFSMLIDLDELDALDRQLKLFSRGRLNLFSFHDRDYGAGGPENLATYIRGVLADAGLSNDGRIKLLCYPRLLGYAFNPLAVYYCHDRQGALAAVIYEVRNTFGGKHSYLIPVVSDADVNRQEADKKFHVSPFMPMEMRYRFRLSRPGEEISVVIRQSDASGAVMNAAFTGRRKELTDRTLLKAFFAYPLMTLKVIAGIHWEALRLILKGMKLVKSPADPAKPVTVVDDRASRKKAA
ncbi:MAG: DUF1365 domain-containing protein [Parvularculaceae bacterium]